MNLLNSPPTPNEEITEESARKQLKDLKKKLYLFITLLLAIALILLLGCKIKKLQDELQYLKDNPVVVDPITPVIDLKVLESEIKAIGELATMEYIYTNAARFSDSRQILRWNIPLTEKAFVMKWDGVIKAGINIEEVNIDIKEKTKLIIIHLPKAEILSHDPDRNSVEVFDEKNGLFNSVKVEDQVKFEAICEEEMNQRAIENGLLEKAEENAKNIILKVLNALPGIEDIYTIEFIVE